eukprot:INCI5723.1.p1 GENE.INCI5723.1~~INCI5723.1.p1  ORF type:complete len:428 (+),score=66.66 INCI5723.1:194-1477(+)
MVSLKHHPASKALQGSASGSSSPRASSASAGKPSTQHVKEILLDVAIAIATFVVLQLLGIPFWARLLICFLSDYLRFVYSSFSSHSLLGSARLKVQELTRKAGKVGEAVLKHPSQLLSQVHNGTTGDASTDTASREIDADADCSALPTFSKSTKTQLKHHTSASKISPRHHTPPSASKNMLEPTTDAVASPGNRNGEAPMTTRKSRKASRGPKSSRASPSIRSTTLESKRSSRRTKSRKVELANLDTSCSPTPTPAIKTISSTEGEHGDHHEVATAKNRGKPRIGHSSPVGIGSAKSATRKQQRRKLASQLSDSPTAGAPSIASTSEIGPAALETAAPSHRNDETNEERPQKLVGLSDLLRIGDDSEFEDQMRHFQSRLQESISSPSDRREKRSAQLKTVIDPGTFAKLLANKRKKTSQKLRQKASP